MNRTANSSLGHYSPPKNTTPTTISLESHHSMAVVVVARRDTHHLIGLDGNGCGLSAAHRRGPVGEAVRAAGRCQSSSEQLALIHSLPHYRDRVGAYYLAISCLLPTITPVLLHPDCGSILPGSCPLFPLPFLVPLAHSLTLEIPIHSHVTLSLLIRTEITALSEYVHWAATQDLSVV